jgi:hypothetical protein
MKTTSCRALVPALLAILFLTAFVPAAHASNVFGRTTIGSIPSNGLTADYKRGARFTLTEPAIVTALYAYMDGMGGTTEGFERIRLVIYQDANGVPGIKVGESRDLNIFPQGLAGWRGFYVDDVPLQPGQYWLVIHTGGTGGIARDYADGAPNWYGNPDNFNDLATSPFGSGATGTGTISIYAEYSRPFERAFAGRSSIAATPSNGLSADFKRASKMTLSEQALVTRLSAYIDGKGGATGEQYFRLALYRDSNGVPGTKLTETGLSLVWTGQPASWRTLSAPPVLLDPGSYWVAIHTGAPAGVIRDYGDGEANWYGNADVFLDQAASPFGTGNAGTGTMSLGFVYDPGPFERRTLGRTTIGTTPSKGLTANYARGQANPAAQVQTAGPITGYWAYLDGLGSTVGLQHVRIALYADDCSQTSPTPLFAYSEAIDIKAGRAPGWVFFPAKTATDLGPACSYRMSLQSGDSQGVVRDYADGNKEWLGIQDEFGNGPVHEYPINPGPGVGVGTGNLSMYVEYAVPAGSP